MWSCDFPECGLREPRPDVRDPRQLKKFKSPRVEAQCRVAASLWTCTTPRGSIVGLATQSRLLVAWNTEAAPPAVASVPAATSSRPLHPLSTEAWALLDRRSQQGSPLRPHTTRSACCATPGVLVHVVVALSCTSLAECVCVEEGLNLPLSRHGSAHSLCTASEHCEVRCKFRLAEARPLLQPPRSSASHLIDPISTGLLCFPQSVFLFGALAAMTCLLLASCAPPRNGLS